MDIGLGSCHRYIRNCILRISQHRSDPSCRYSTGIYDYSNVAAGTCSGSLADRERIRSISNRFSAYENSDEQAFERSIDLHQGEGGLNPLSLPAGTI